MIPLVNYFQIRAGRLFRQAEGSPDLAVAKAPGDQIRHGRLAGWKPDWRGRHGIGILLAPEARGILGSLCVCVATSVGPPSGRLLNYAGEYSWVLRLPAPRRTPHPVHACPRARALRRGAHLDKVIGAGRHLKLFSQSTHDLGDQTKPSRRGPVLVTPFSATSPSLTWGKARTDPDAARGSW